MTEIRALVDDAINVLCTRFEQHGYNPTPIVDLGVLVARADGKVDDAEKKALRDVFEARARLVAEILKDCDAVEQGIVVALGIAYASEGLSKDERAVIDMIAKAAGLAPERVDALAKQVKAKLPEDGGPVSARDSLHGPAAKRSVAPESR